MDGVVQNQRVSEDSSKIEKLSSQSVEIVWCCEGFVVLLVVVVEEEEEKKLSKKLGEPFMLALWW